MRRLLVAAAAVACTVTAAHAQTAQELSKPDNKYVLNYGMDYGQQRYSPLTQIDTKSIKKLVPAWNLSYDDLRSEESQPLVYNGVLYVTTNSATIAVDAKTGRQIWKTKVEYPPETPRVVCCGIINRGAALYEGKIIRGTLDAKLVALDAKTGKQLWKSDVADMKAGYTMTGAPQIADGVIMTGISGAEFGTRDFIDGWDPNDGKHLWRTYTVPLANEKGGDTWPGDTAKYGGGSTWITGSFDPELHTVYWGIGNPGPFNASGRKGDNLYTCSVLALDPKTGQIKWHYQFSPNNPFDYDSVAEMILSTIDVKGTPTKVLIDANRNGFIYVLDRTNGKLIAANPYVKVNWASGIDLTTGRPIETDVTTKARAGEPVDIFPSILGGKNWEPGSYDQKRGLAFYNTLNFGGHYKSVPAEYKQGEWYVGMDLTNPWNFADSSRGYLKAVDPMTGKAKWEAPSDMPRFSGVLSTAGGVVFTGQLTGEFEAFNSDTGEKLWSFQTGSGVEGQPITWEQDGEQYVAVSVGIGGVYSLFSGDERLASVPPGGSLWAFKLAK